MIKPRGAGLLFAVLLAAAGILGGLTSSDAQQPTGGAISAFRAIYENVSGTLGRFRLDTTNNFYVFGSSKPIPGAVLVSSGTAVIQSTSTVATNPILQIRNAAGTILGSWQQGGNLQLLTGQFLGDGSALAGLPGVASVVTWTNSQFFAKDVNISSGTASVLNIGAGTAATSGSLVIASQSTGTVNGLMSVPGTLSATGPVKISTGASVTFPSTLGFTSTQASFTPSASVTGSTISFTVQGTTVACWTSGNIGTNGTLLESMGIGVDGTVSKIPGTSSTVGVWSMNTTASFLPITTYTEFQVTGGGVSHAFWLGIWTAGNTLTFPAAGNIAQFGCREVPSR